jgi:hypothetical protein
MEMTYAVRVSQWCEDSLDLLDLMCALVPGESRAAIRAEGKRFFSIINYNRASKVGSPAKRLQAYFTVFRKFGYQHPPSKRHVMAQLAGNYQKTPVYAALRAVKRGVKHVFGMCI